MTALNPFDTYLVTGGLGFILGTGFYAAVEWAVARWGWRLARRRRP